MSAATATHSTASCSEAQLERVREAVVERAEEHDAGDRHADRVADLLHRRQRAGRRARALRLERREDRRGQRRDDEAHARADEQQGGGEEADRAGRPDVRDARGEQAVAGRQDERADGRQAAPEARGQGRRLHRRDEVGDGEDREHEPGLEGVEPAPELEVQREDEEERRLAGPEHELGQQPGAERAVAEQRRIEQRRAAAAAEPALVDGERAEQDGRGAECQPRPQRPAVLAALDERQDDRRQPGGDEHRPGDVDPARAPGVRLGDEARGERERRERRSGR